MTKRSLFFILSFLFLNVVVNAQGHGHENTPAPHGTPAKVDTPAVGHPTHAENAPVHNQAGAEHTEAHKEEAYDPTPGIMNHISNTNEFHYFGHYSIPLPCMLYSKEDGLNMFMSSAFHHGAIAKARYVSDHGVTKRIIDSSFPNEEVELEPVHGDGDEAHYFEHVALEGGEEDTYVKYKGQRYKCEKASGLLTATSFYDFSITKNVATMILSGLFILFLGVKTASSYKKNPTGAPKGTLVNMMETLVAFIRDDIAKPNIGEKYEKFLPYLLVVFFFILLNNFIGLIPFAPFGSNVTGNIATTAALALVTFIVTNVNGTSDYWKHILWMPGVPTWLKPILAVIESVGIFTKPISLMVRLFANITAGHIIVLALVSLIFVFGNAGASQAGASAGALVAVPFTVFLSCIELLVAFIQAYIFTMLTASYIGGALESHDHHHEEAHH